MAMYGVTVRHFAHRTRKNLETIERFSAGEENKYFEVTQLINSAVGLVMFPQQEYFDQLPTTALKDLEKVGWPSVAFEHGSSKTSNLRDFVRYIRNSIAHFNVDFRADGGRIAGVYLWNRQNVSEPPDWLCYIPIDDLRTIFNKFAGLVERYSRDSYKELRVQQIRSEIKRS